MEKINDHLFLIGTTDLPSFLIVGEKKVVMVDAGPIYMAPVFLQQIGEVLTGGRRPDLLVFTHSHFDHVGGAPYLKRRMPGLLLGGDEYLFSVMQRPGARRIIEGLNRRLTDPALIDRFEPPDFDYSVLMGDLILADGQIIDLGGGVTVEAIKTPGHTQDSMSYFIRPGDSILTGEALGVIPGEDLYVGPEFLTSFDDYVDSIKKIGAKKARLILTGHHSMAYSTQVDRFIDASLRDAELLKDKIERYLTEEGMDEAKVIERVKGEEYLTARQGRQPEEAYLLNLTAQVRLLKKGLTK